MTLRIVGAGFGRTGTNSLKLALEQLGFGPCHHMFEVRQRPEQVAFWAAAARGERNDWDTVFEGFNAAVDWPSAFFWRELAAHYPQAKVILSVRPEEEWLRSIQSTIFQSIKSRNERKDELGRAGGEMAYDLIARRTFHGRIDDPDHVLAVYRRNILEVKREIPAERLLVYNTGEGWEPLCRFLGVPVPVEDYPRTNSTKEFRDRLASQLQPKSD